MTELMPSYDGAIRRGTEDTDTPEILPATHGLFSTPFYWAVRRNLDLMPELIEHVVALHTARGGNDGDRIQASKEVPLPFSSKAWDDANDLYRAAVYWATHFSRTTGIPAPGPAARAWRNELGQVVGLPPYVEAQQARAVTARMTIWLTSNLDRIFSRDPDDVAYFAEALREVRHIDSRWPRQEPTSWSRLPCPKDDSRVGIYPPDRPGGERRYVCEGGHIMNQEEYEAAVADLVAGTKIARQLARKYMAV